MSGKTAWPIGWVACVCGIWIASALLGGTRPGYAAEPGHVLNNVIPELVDCRQVIVVTTTRWNSVSAQLACFERTTPESAWHCALPPSPAVIGRNGLAWGIGLHGTNPPDEAIKREGDGCTPAGVFSLEEAFGYATPGEAAVQNFPYRHVTNTVEGIDDPASRYYNRLIDATRVTKDWRSSEQMLREDGAYRWGVVIQHNWKPYPGYGSCIFLHGWSGSDQPTAGCTALPLDKVKAIIRWLDKKKRPFLVQLPANEYDRWKRAWLLPEHASPAGGVE